MSASYSLITLICEGWAVEEGRQMEAREGGGRWRRGGSFGGDSLIEIHGFMSGSIENTQQAGQLLAAVNEDVSPSPCLSDAI